MLQIHYSPSFERVRNFAKNYNKQFLETKESNYSGSNGHEKKQVDPENKNQIKDLKKMLRRSHVQLMEKLIICLSQQLNLDQKLYGAMEFSIMDDDLPWLRTNNCALATLLQCSNRTIQRQLNRLEEAGFIENRTYHGTRCDYKLKIKTSLLHLVQNGIHVLFPCKTAQKTVENRTENGGKGVENRTETVRKTVENRTEKTTENLVFSNEGTTNFPLNDKNNLFKNNTLFTNGEIVDKSSISDLISFLKGTTTRQRNSEVESKQLEISSHLVTKEQEKTPPPVAAHPPKSEEIDPRVKKYGQMLINFMYATIFSRQHFHAPSQIECTRQYLNEELSHLTGRELTAKFEELKIRVQLTWEWLERDPDRFIPIPSVYLDRSNKNGFIRTILWFHTFKENKRNLKEANERTMEFYSRWEILNKVLNKYLEDQNVDAYKRAKKHLGKKHPEISDAFDLMVLNSNKKFVA